MAHGHLPFVGREAELGVLGQAIDATRRGGAGVFFLSGGAGIGKTRLAAEVARLAARSGLRVARGRATSRAIPYRLLSEALLSVVREAGPPDDPKLGPYRPALACLVPEMGPRGTGPEPTPSPVVLAEAVLRLLASAMGASGGLVILDDLHDCDEDTLAVVEYLCDNLGRAPILLLGTIGGRAAAAMDLALRLAQRGAATLLELGPLSDQEADELAAGILDVPVEALPQQARDRLRAEALGVPLYVEVLCDMPDGNGAVPPRMLRHANACMEELGQAGREVLRAAAVLGRRFRLSTLASLVPEEARLMEGLRAATSTGMLVANADPDRYAFKYPLMREALRAGLMPAERAQLARRAAAAVEEWSPAPPRERYELAAHLWLEADDHPRAAAYFLEAGRNARAEGAIPAAVSLLGRGLDLLTADASGSGTRADLVDELLDAHLTAGRFRDAHELVQRFSRGCTAPRRAAWHIRLARACLQLGRWDECDQAIRLARVLLNASACAGSDVTALALDAVEARRAAVDPVPHRRDEARDMALRAWRAATAAGLGEPACEALEALGHLARQRDLSDADGFYTRALEIAREDGLTAWRARLLLHLGAHDAARTGTLARLTQAREVASAAGAPLAVLEVDGCLALAHAAAGRYDESDQLARGCERAAKRLGHHELWLAGLGVRVCVAAHRGLPADVERLLQRFREAGGEDAPIAPTVWGFGLACRALLEEDRDLALREAEKAVALQRCGPAASLSLVDGLHIFLGTLRGESGWAEYRSLAASARSQVAWDRGFIHLTGAVLHGREGRAAQALAAVDDFAAVPAPRPLSHHLGLRLVAQAALDDGWGDPVPWLREAESYFRAAATPSALAACRALIRRAGGRVPQHRRGSADIPRQLRRLGITVREHEVLELIGSGLSTKQIAQRLYLSPRTIEKHVANLLAKTGKADRSALARVATASH